MGNRADNEVQTFTGENTAVGSSLVVIGDPILVHGQKSRLVAHVINTGVILTNFQIQIAADETAYAAGNWNNLIQGATDWASETISIKPYVDITGGVDLSVLPTAERGSFEILMPGVHAFRVRASCATSTSLLVSGQLVRLSA